MDNPVKKSIKNKILKNGFQTQDGFYYRNMGMKPYVKKNGASTMLHVWEGHCAECSAPFICTTSQNAKYIQNINKRCRKHRMPGIPASHTAKLRHSRGAIKGGSAKPKQKTQEQIIREEFMLRKQEFKQIDERVAERLKLREDARKASMIDEERLIEKEMDLLRWEAIVDLREQVRVRRERFARMNPEAELVVVNAITGERKSARLMKHREASRTRRSAQ